MKTRLCKLCLFKTEFDDEAKTEMPDVNKIIKMLKDLFKGKVRLSSEEASAVCRLCTEKVQYCHEYCMFVLENQKKYKAKLDPVISEESQGDVEVFVAPLVPLVEIEEKKPLIELKNEIHEAEKPVEDTKQENDSDIEFENSLDRDSDESADDSFQIETRRRKRVSKTTETWDKILEEPKRRPRKSERVEKKPRESRIKKEAEEKESLIKKYFEMKCDDCNQLFTDYRALQKHMLSAHTHKKMFICCGALLATQVQLYRHALDHDNPSICPICGSMSYGKAKHGQHMLEMHGVVVQDDENEMYECDLCHKKLNTKRKMENHMMYAHLTRTRTFVCETCAVTYRSQCSLNIHIQRDHLKVELPKSQCPTCGKWILTTGMPFHVRSHLQAPPQEKFKCSQCGSEHRQYKGLLKHVRRHHSEASNRYKCTMCSKGFFDKKNFEEHFAIHTGQILYTCEWCNAGFKSGGNYLAHKRKLHPILYAQQKLENKLKREELSKPKQQIQTIELKKALK